MTLEELERLGINPQSVTESLGQSTKGWLCDDSGEVVGPILMALAEDWLAASGCERAWLTTDLDATLRA